MKGIVICTLCAMATLTLGWGWQYLDKSIQPIPSRGFSASAATVATVNTLGSMAAITSSQHAGSGVSTGSGFANTAILASTRHTSVSSEIVETLPVVGLIGLLAFGGAVGLQVARRRV